MWIEAKSMQEVFLVQCEILLFVFQTDLREKD